MFDVFIIIACLFFLAPPVKHCPMFDIAATMHDVTYVYDMPYSNETRLTPVPA